MADLRAAALVRHVVSSNRRGLDAVDQLQLLQIYADTPLMVAIEDLGGTNV